MANCCQALRPIAAPCYNQNKQGESLGFTISGQRNFSTCSYRIGGTSNTAQLEVKLCLSARKSTFSSLLQKNLVSQSHFWGSNLKVGVVLEGMAFIRLQGRCNLVSDENHFPWPQVFRMSEEALNHTSILAGIRNANAKVFKSGLSHFVCSATADGHNVQEIDSYPAMLSIHGTESLESTVAQAANVSQQTRLLNITIDGVSNNIDLQRFQAQLKDIFGVVDVWLGPLMEGGIRGEFVTVQMQVDESIPSVLLVNEIQKLDPELLILPYKSNMWFWRGHKINFAVAGCGKAVILVHGFGGNAGHFAKLIPYLTDHYRVYAIDLLGFGASDKPVDANYGPELWAELICDFTKEFAEEGAVLIGNSIGSLTCLAAAAVGGDLFRGLVLLNCAGAMNRKGLMQDDPLIRALSPIFIAIEYLLQRPSIANFLFERFRRKENIRTILEEQAYRNRASVTDQLVDILYKPSTQAGASDVFVKVFTGDPGPRPESLMENISAPLLLLWGDRDIWTPVNGRVAKYFVKLAAERDNVAVYSLPDVGHCPHDDRPELAANYILPFVASLG